MILSPILPRPLSHIFLFQPIPNMTVQRIFIQSSFCYTKVSRFTATLYHLCELSPSTPPPSNTQLKFFTGSVSPLVNTDVALAPPFNTAQVPHKPAPTTHNTSTPTRAKNQTNAHAPSCYKEKQNKKRSSRGALTANHLSAETTPSIHNPTPLPPPAALPPPDELLGARLRMPPEASLTVP